jgi:hypothetical protein
MEFTAAGLQAQNDQHRLEGLRIDVELFARDLGKRFKELGPETQSLCVIEIEVIKAFLSKINQQFLEAETKCAETASAEREKLKKAAADRAEKHP